MTLSILGAAGWNIKQERIEKNLHKLLSTSCTGRPRPESVGAPESHSGLGPPWLGLLGRFPLSWRGGFSRRQQLAPVCGRREAVGESAPLPSLLNLPSVIPAARPRGGRRRLLPRWTRLDEATRVSTARTKKRKTTSFLTELPACRCFLFTRDLLTSVLSWHSCRRGKTLFKITPLSGNWVFWRHFFCFCLFTVSSFLFFLRFYVRKVVLINELLINYLRVFSHEL